MSSDTAVYHHKLTWSTPTGGPRPTPDGVERIFLPTPSGVLDLHFSRPSPSSASSRPPILFIHGGFGSALCWRHYLPFFAAEGYPAYAVSLHGHGDSWNPGYWRMYFAPRQRFIEDACWAIRHVRQEHGVDPIVVGHSAGGGISQDLIAQGLERVRGLALLSAIPGYGSYRVNLNWAKIDPFMTIRMLFLHFLHPRSPLSSTKLVHNAFFSPEIPTSQVMEVEKTMSVYESMSWPLSMLWQYVDPKKFVTNLGEGKGRVLVVAGEKDRLMTFDLMKRMADWYRAAISALSSDGGRKKNDEDAAPDSDDSATRVGLEVAPGVGHHMMLDVRWKESAEIVLRWLQANY